MADISKIVLPDTSEYNVKDAGAARQNEAICLARAHNGDGILDGCEMAINGTTLEILSGSVLAGGKVAYFPTGYDVSLGGISTTDGYVQVILNIQLSHNPQVWITLEESPTTTFDPLTQNDLNIAGNLYQMELCVVQVIGGALSSIVSKIKGSDFIVDGRSGSPMLVMRDADGAKGYFFYDTATDSVRIWNPTGNNGIVAYDNGEDVVHANAKSIYIRPNGRTSQSGQLSVDQYGHMSQYGATGQSDNAYYMYDASGNCWGRIYGKSGNFRFAKYVSGTADKHGLDLRDGAIVLYGTNIPIYIRPQGSEVSTGQITLSSNGNVSMNGDLTITGDVHRTPHTYSASQTSSKSLTANTNTKVCTATVATAGVYIISVSAHIAASSAGSVNMNTYKANNNSNKIAYSAQYCKASSTWIQSITWATFTAGAYCSFYLEPNMACTYDSAYLELLRIA